MKKYSNKDLEQIAKMARTFINMQMKTANDIYIEVTKNNKNDTISNK
ncbi:MAG TPA: hypothetical protein PLX79_04100 [Candidatus Dojkabacteria bacterium]|nr:hypothetical protein [Candidatus Dojkabacteria bacterium]